MAIYGYHRTSTREQHLDRGLIEIEEFCKKNNLPLVKIYTDQQTGKNFDRPRYTVLKEDVLRSNDVLILTELDRLGRNKHDIMQQLQYYRENAIRIMVLELPTTLVDLRNMDNVMARLMLETINNMMFELYASIAQAEMDKKEKRQREGIAAKKLRGEWADYGRPNSCTMQDFGGIYAQVCAGNLRAVDAMKALKISKSTYYRYVHKLDK